MAVSRRADKAVVSQRKPAFVVRILALGQPTALEQLPEYQLEDHNDRKTAATRTGDLLSNSPLYKTRVRFGEGRSGEKS